MNEDQFGRLVQSFESIAESLKRWCDHEFPERREPRDAVVSRIKTEEDLAKERQGASTGPISEWFGGFEDKEYVGVYEKAFLEEERQRDASATVQSDQGQNQAGAEAAGGKARGRRKRTPDHPPVEES